MDNSTFSQLSANPGWPEAPAQCGLQAVLSVLTASPRRQAYAGELADAVAVASGVSRRQAQRWIKAALAEAPDVIVRAPKTDSGTLYRLAAAVPAVEPTEALPAELAGVPRHHRRDVALTLRALIAENDETEFRVVAERIAASTGRPLDWALVVVGVALPYVTDVVSTWTPDRLGTRTYLSISPEVSGRALRPWSDPVDFRLPTGRAQIQQMVRERLDVPRLQFAAGEVEVLKAIAGLGGDATGRELSRQSFEAPANELVQRLQAGGPFPRWLEVDVQGDFTSTIRFRLHAALWP